MKEEKDYIQDIAEIRSMMERSTKFLSLSGWSGILAGVYALAGVFVAWKLHPGIFSYGNLFAGPDFLNIGLVFLLVLLLAITTAIIDAHLKAKRKGQKAWNAISKRLLLNMAVPLVTGGLLILILIYIGLNGFEAPLTLIFYGLALYNAGNFTFNAVRVLGIIQICLGLISCYFIDFSWIFWMAGFGVMHIVYGIYMFKYAK